MTNEVCMIYKCKTRIVPYVLTIDILFTKLHRQYCSLIEILVKTDVYISKIAPKKTFECIFLGRRRGIEEEDKEFGVGQSVKCLVAAYVNVLIQYIR